MLVCRILIHGRSGFMDKKKLINRYILPVTLLAAVFLGSAWMFVKAFTDYTSNDFVIVFAMTLFVIGVFSLYTWCVSLSSEKNIERQMEKRMEHLLETMAVLDKSISSAEEQVKVLGNKITVKAREFSKVKDTELKKQATETMRSIQKEYDDAAECVSKLKEMKGKVQGEIDILDAQLQTIYVKQDTERAEQIVANF